MADPRNLPPAEDVSVLRDDLDIKDEEREEIEQEIDELVSQSSSRSTLAREHLQPRRNGIGLPLLIWLLAGAAFAAGFIYISNYFEVREQTIALESREYFTAEAQLIREILRESEARLAEKDQEIGQIQDRLARLDAEKQGLEQNLENEIADREAELRAQLERELENARQRLTGEGRSEEEISEQIAELEAVREAEVEAQLDAFRTEAEEQVAELQAQLSNQEAQLQQALEASREERDRLAQEAAEREAELRQEFNEELEELAESEQAALARIDELQELRSQEQLLTDRILGSFTVIVQDIEEGMTDEALAGLASLERLLLDEGTATGDRQRRRRTELALVSTLRSLVQEIDVLRDNIAVRDLTATDEETARLEQERAAELIETARSTVELAEDARQAGRFGEAQSLYQQALATIPSLGQVYPGILDLESTRRQVTLQSAVGEAQSLLADGDARQAVERYLESVRMIASDEDDPLLDVAEGIDRALEQTTRAAMDAQEEVVAEYRQEIETGDAQAARLARNLSAAQNSLATANATVQSLRSELAGVRSELATQRALAAERATALTALRREVTGLEDELATARTDLRAALSRATSLQESLANAQTRVAEVERENRRLETQIAAEEDRTVVEREETIEELENRMEETRAELTRSRSTIDELQADLTEANAQIAGLREQVTSLQERRTASTDETDELQQTLESLRTRVTELEGLEESIGTLTDQYERALANAQRRIENGDYARARSAVLVPFEIDQGRNLFPGFVTTLNTAHRRLVDAAEAETGGEVRERTLEEIVGLATEVQQNIEEPRESAGVQSYLRREPELRPVADELFEIVELSRRAISAPEIEYRLLGSVSRVTGNLVVAERLVALEPVVGDSVEIRRAPTLEQEAPVAAGTVIEITDRRVVVSIDEIYELETLPATRDLVYIAVE